MTLIVEGVCFFVISLATFYIIDIMQEETFMNDVIELDTGIPFRRSITQDDFTYNICDVKQHVR
jgi:hypothetical protein